MYFLANYSVVQLSFTPEIDVFYMLSERSLAIFSRTSLKRVKQHIDYINFLRKIQLDLPVHTVLRWVNTLQCKSLQQVPRFPFLGSLWLPKQVSRNLSERKLLFGVYE